MENKINDLNKNVVKMSNALRQMASTTRADYCSRNLLDIIGTDFGDYGRQLMRVLYTKEELQSCILPPGRRHLARPPLDSEHCPIKSDFLIEECRLDELKILRKPAKLASVHLESQQSID
ncbi:unnamed protein product [Adineta steineri]|uniref:Uncharacterized protein n=1 Tax=Adineta steineri TaxID=433720 RepID=A0A814KTL4_9BILA|nr:unnamed protein product [Adineta steineri]